MITVQSINHTTYHNYQRPADIKVQSITITFNLDKVFLNLRILHLSSSHLESSTENTEKLSFIAPLTLI